MIYWDLLGFTGTHSDSSGFIGIMVGVIEVHRPVMICNLEPFSFWGRGGRILPKENLQFATFGYHDRCR